MILSERFQTLKYQLQWQINSSFILFISKQTGQIAFFLLYTNSFRFVYDILFRLIDSRQNALYSISLSSSYSFIFCIVTSRRLTCVCSFSSEFEINFKQGCSGTSFSPCLHQIHSQSALPVGRQQVRKSSLQNECLRSHVQEVYDDIVRLVDLGSRDVALSDFGGGIRVDVSTCDGLSDPTCTSCERLREFRREGRRGCHRL